MSFRISLFCTDPSCKTPENATAEISDRQSVQRLMGMRCAACAMPLTLNDRYLPYRLLAKGGFAAAYLAIDAQELRPCVVKQLQPNPRLDTVQRELAQTLFQREAIVLSQLGVGHPQIPNLYDFFTFTLEPEDDRGIPQEFFYLVQEFIAGETLATKMKTQGSLSVPVVLDVFEQVLEILCYVHQNHSIHRDIKPSNLMCHPSGKIYLLDFGAVKQISQSGTTSPDWSTSIYSPGYAPPEQMSGGAVYTATDLYALGVTCIVLLTAQKPKKLLDSYDRSWHYRDYVHLSDRFAAILDRCLATAPSARYPSAVEALEALRSVERSDLLEGVSTWTIQTDHREKKLTDDSLDTPQPLPPVENPPGDDDETGLMDREPLPLIPETILADVLPAMPARPIPVRSIPAPFMPAPAPPDPDLTLPTSSLSPASSLNPAPSSIHPSHGSTLPAPVETDLLSVGNDRPDRRTAVRPFKPRLFTPWELLAQGAFTGSQGAFLAIVLHSIPSLGLRVGLWFLAMLGLIWVQRQRWIEKYDLLILPGLELICLLLFSGLRSLGNQTIAFGEALILMGLAACIGVAVLALFHLIYQSLEKLL